MEAYPVFLLLILRIPQKLRILGSMVVILVVFLVTAIFVKVDMAPLPFFSVTMIKIICINCELLNFNANFVASVVNSHVSNRMLLRLRTLFFYARNFNLVLEMSTVISTFQLYSHNFLFNH